MNLDYMDFKNRFNPDYAGKKINENRFDTNLLERNRDVWRLLFL